jgi:hypothetical protein
VASKPLTIESLVKKLHLTPRVARLAGLRRVDNATARAQLGHERKVNIKPTPDSRDFSGILFSASDLYGNERGPYQVRRDNPELDAKGKEECKYMTRPGKTDRYLACLPGAPARLKKRGVRVVLVESFKAVLAGESWAERSGHNIVFVALGGLDGWHTRETEDGPSHPSPDLAQLKGIDVSICPDSNAGRPDLRKKVAALDEVLLTIGAQSTEVITVPALEGVNGPDDLLSAKGDVAFTKIAEQAKPLWLDGFPSVSDFAGQEMKADLLIPGLIANHSVTLLASPSENFKTMTALLLSRSLLDGEPAFEHDGFAVEKTVKGVIYMCPDMSHEMIVTYARQFGLDKIKEFRIRTMKQGDVLMIDHPWLKAAAKTGYYIVLDTFNYFTGADDDNNPLQLRKIFTDARTLIDEYNGPGLMALVHPTKAGAMNGEINLTEWVSGSYGKIGSVDSIHCLKRIVSEIDDVVYEVWLQREKGRPFLGVRLDPFTFKVRDDKGDSYIDRGRMPIGRTPGKAGKLSDHLPKKARTGPEETSDKAAKLEFLNGYVKANMKGNKRPSCDKIAEAMNATFATVVDGKPHGTPHSGRTVNKWMKEMVDDTRLMAEFKENTNGGKAKA